jgi:hypothetical protein
MDGRLAKVAQPLGRGTRLVTLENATISLQGLAERAGLGLNVARALAGTVGAKAPT